LFPFFNIEFNLIIKIANFMLVIPSLLLMLKLIYTFIFLRKQLTQYQFFSLLAYFIININETMASIFLIYHFNMITDFFANNYILSSIACAFLSFSIVKIFEEDYHKVKHLNKRLEDINKELESKNIELEISKQKLTDSYNLTVQKLKQQQDMNLKLTIVKRCSEMGLTEKETDIITARVNNISEKELALDYKMSQRNLQRYIRSAYNKLGVGSITELQIKADEWMKDYINFDIIYMTDLKGKN
jgi:DNA-binding CsgD family transcriptional regulator